MRRHLQAHLIDRHADLTKRQNLGARMPKFDEGNLITAMAETERQRSMVCALVGEQLVGFTAEACPAGDDRCCSVKYPVPCRKPGFWC